MADPTDRDVIRRVIEDCGSAMLLLVRPEDQDELADRIAAALAEAHSRARPGPAWRDLKTPAADGSPEYETPDAGAHPGPGLLEAWEVDLYRRWAAVGTEGSPLARLLAHIDAQAGELEALRAEVRRVLRFSRSRGPNREYIVQFGHAIKPHEVPLVAALLREPGRNLTTR